MNEHFTSSIVTVLSAIIGVAILAVLVSNAARTSDVISSASTGFSDIIKAAVSPLGQNNAFSIPTIQTH